MKKQANRLRVRSISLKTLKFLALAFIMFILSSGNVAFAAQKPSMTISPFLQDVKFSAQDATKTFPVTLTNNGPQTVNVRLSIVDFGSLNDSGGIVFAGTKSSSLINKYGLSHWLQLSESSLDIESGTSRNITATIIDDTTLKPGGHYSAIIASVIDPNPTLQDQIGIVQKLTSLIFATKVGGEKYDLILQKIIKPSSSLTLPKTVNLEFKNPGNVHVVPRGTVKIMTPGGRVISEGIINEDSSFVLPETSRQLTVAMRPLSASGLWPSLYTIEVSYRYDGVDYFAHKQAFLYFVNVPALVTILLILIVITTLCIKNRHHVKKIKAVIKRGSAKRKK